MGAPQTAPKPQTLAALLRPLNRSFFTLHPTTYTLNPKISTEKFANAQILEIAQFAEIAVCADSNRLIECSDTSHTSNSSHMLYGCGLNHIVITY